MYFFSATSAIKEEKFESSIKPRKHIKSKHRTGKWDICYLQLKYCNKNLQGSIISKSLYHLYKWPAREGDIFFSKKKQPYKCQKLNQVKKMLHERKKKWLTSKNAF